MKYSLCFFGVEKTVFDGFEALRPLKLGEPQVVQNQGFVVICELQTCLKVYKS